MLPIGLEERSARAAVSRPRRRGWPWIAAGLLAVAPVWLVARRAPTMSIAAWRAQLAGAWTIEEADLTGPAVDPTERSPDATATGVAQLIWDRDFGRLAASLGCTWLGGWSSTFVDGGHLEGGPFEPSAPPPSCTTELVQREAALAALLAGRPQVVLSDDRVTLRGAAGTVVAVRALDGAEDRRIARALPGRWTLVAENGAGVPTPVELGFDANRVGSSDACPGEGESEWFVAGGRLWVGGATFQRGLPCTVPGHRPPGASLVTLDGDRLTLTAPRRTLEAVRTRP